ncbi:MAG: hypothetical protein VKO21_05015 [Candidatus Sericytochromatia bacterium]|nr:hypothetical protein [Candidatus Sericytochromatia bacterium]
MAHETHEAHDHAHGDGCGHLAIQHGDHVDHLHDGHLHHAHEGHVDECQLEVGEANPAECTPGHDCSAHAGDHVHADDCGHEAVPHGDHMDYLVAGHLHHPHEGHCDHHGQIQVA